MYLKQTCECQEEKLSPYTLWRYVCVSGCTDALVLSLGTGRIWGINVPAAFPQGKISLCPLRRTLGGSQSWWGHFAEIRLLPLQSSEPWSRSLVNTPSRLQAFEATYLRCASLWIGTQRRLVCCWRFGREYRFHFQGSRCPLSRVINLEWAFNNQPKKKSIKCTASRYSPTPLLSAVSHFTVRLSALHLRFTFK